jgi:hypothetical protein
MARLARQEAAARNPPNAVGYGAPSYSEQAMRVVNGAQD